MSTLEQMKGNIAIYEENKALNETEWNTLLAVAEGMMRNVLPCTSCRYCTSHCPMELDIPFLLELYNEHKFTGSGFIAPMALSSLPENKKPAACIGCRCCEAVCPQTIEISKAMADFAAIL